MEFRLVAAVIIGELQATPLQQSPIKRSFKAGDEGPRRLPFGNALPLRLPGRASRAAPLHAVAWIGMVGTDAAMARRIGNEGRRIVGARRCGFDDDQREQRAEKNFSGHASHRRTRILPQF